MKLVLQREVLSDKATIGQLSIDGENFCFTLEDVVRSGPKVDGITAIPAGRYRVEVSRSVRFQKDLPLLIDVPGFTAIRIHSGNTSADTEGCILIGLQKGVDSIGRSRAAMDLFMPRLEEGLKQGEVWIDVRNP